MVDYSYLSRCKKIYGTRTKAIPDAFNHMPWNNSEPALPVVVVEDDAEPFVRKGRNVFTDLSKHAILG